MSAMLKFNYSNYHGAIMNMAGCLKNALLAQKTDKFIREIIDLSKRLPKNSFYEFDKNLLFYVESIPEYLTEQEHLFSKIDKARNLIKLNIVIKECIEKLILIERLKFSKTNELVQDANEVYNLIDQDYHISDFVKPN
jgi:hypothetical protein